VCSTSRVTAGVDAAGGRFARPDGGISGRSRTSRGIPVAGGWERPIDREPRFDWDCIVGRVREQYVAALAERRNARAPVTPLQVEA
jgi:hypothetical protein